MRALACLPLIALAVLPLACGSSSNGSDPIGPEADASLESGSDAGKDSPTDTLSDTSAAGDADSSVEKDAAPESSTPLPLPGIYEVTGSDGRWGAYTGQAEIRQGASGLEAVHLHRWSSAKFEGDDLAMAWTGTAKDSAQPEVSFELDRVGFVTAYGSEKHEAIDPPVVAYSAKLVRKAPDTLEAVFTPTVATEPTYTETWKRVSDPGTDPLWKNERRLVAMHAPPPAATKASLFQTYATYHELPQVAPYVSRPEFQAAVHYQVIDPTDFEYYRANPGVLRVIQKVPDTIGIVETRIRNRAFRQTLAQKQALYDEQMPSRFLNGAGMLVAHDTAKTPPAAWVPSGDSMLWTGVYLASQAMRYLETKEPIALQNMLKGLDAQFLCYDIVGQSGQFARTVREHVDPVGSWVQGTGAYAAWDWMPGCNNDMLQGYYVGFTWANMVLKDLPGHDARKAKMAAILDALVQDNADAGDKKLNEFKADYLLYWLTKDLKYKLAVETLWTGVKYWLVDQGNGPLWQYGTSDWSGNHLIIQGLLVPYVVSSQLNDNHTDELSQGLRKSLELMRDTRLGLFQLIGASLGGFNPAPPELEDNRWVLREFPAPKVRHAIDKRIHSSFCMSPFPSLPWKNDWTTGDRFASLNGYPLFEKVPDVFAWKQGPFEFRDYLSTEEEPGTDFLFAYWFGRYYGFIQPDE